MWFTDVLWKFTLIIPWKLFGVSCIMTQVTPGTLLLLPLALPCILKGIRKFFLGGRGLYEQTTLFYIAQSYSVYYFLKLFANLFVLYHDCTSKCKCIYCTVCFTCALVDSLYWHDFSIKGATSRYEVGRGSQGCFPCCCQGCIFHLHSGKQPFFLKHFIYNFSLWTE